MTPCRSLAPTYVGELYSALHHATGCVAVEREHSRRERSVVGADTHSPAQLLALEYERLEALLDGDKILVKLLLYGAI